MFKTVNLQKFEIKVDSSDEIKLSHICGCVLNMIGVFEENPLPVIVPIDALIGSTVVYMGDFCLVAGGVRKPRFQLAFEFRTDLEAELRRISSFELISLRLLEVRARFMRVLSGEPSLLIHRWSFE